MVQVTKSFSMHAKDTNYISGNPAKDNWINKRECVLSALTTSSVVVELLL